MVIENTLAFKNFMLECGNIQCELKDFHESRLRQIEHCFQKLSDNVPNEIKNTPISVCFREFEEALESNAIKTVASKKGAAKTNNDASIASNFSLSETDAYVFFNYKLFF